MKLWRTLKFKVFVVCAGLSLVLMFLLFYVFFQDIKRAYAQRDIEQAVFNLQMIVRGIERDYTQIMACCTWLSGSDEITRFLTGSLAAGNYGYDRVKAYNAVQKQLLNSGIYDKIDKCIISNRNGDHVSLGTVFGHWSDYPKALDFLLEGEGRSSGDIVGLQFYFSRKSKSIPVYDEIYSSIGAKKIGWVQLFINERLITDQLHDHISPRGSRLFAIIGGRFYEISDQKLSDGLEIAGLETAEYRSLATDAFLITGIPEFKGQPLLAVRSPVTGWFIAQSLPPLYFSDISILAYTSFYIAALVILAIFMLILYMLFRIINKPINRICSRIRLIATGDFSKDAGLETDDEFGVIGRGINEMSLNIKELIEKNKENQRQKKNYEFKMLQNQVNPHFLYNTLNSIKWMATVQNSTGIVEMTAALARMLRRIAEIREETVTVEKELEFISDYIVIQSYRYGGSFTMHYNMADERLKKAKIIMFTLQPLVENSIFHGIEPKKVQCTIDITIYEDSGSLVLEVRDDGVGISEEALSELNKFEIASTSDHISGIGLANIHQRLRLEYGGEYGLHLSSEKGKYTCITVRVPLVF